MSKTLFNTNTFQSKTLQNSNTIDIGESNVTNFTATNATITNLTNTELQAATSGVATNTSAIANKQDEITASNRLSATLIGANGNVSNTEYGYLQNVSSDIQDQLTFNAQATTTNTNNIATNTSNIATNTSNISNNTSNISNNTSNIATNTSNIATNTSNIATNTSNIATNTSNIASNTSNIATNTSNIASNTSNIATNTSNIATNTSNIATNATDINTNKTNINGITASGSLTTLTNRLNIQAGGIPQLILDRPSNGDVEIQLVGKRTGSTSSRHTRIDFQNDDSGVTPSVRTMVSVVGRVTNHTTNVGGLEIVNFVDGQTETGALTMSHNGNFNIGGGSAFQDNFKVSINGTLNVESAIYQIPQLVSYNFDKAIVSNDLWGQGNYQTDLDSTRTSGTAFSSHSSGIITFSQTGTYHIKVSGNLQSIRQNDRLAFAIYLVTLDSVNDPITDYFENSNYNFFGWIYSRNTTDGAHGNISFQDHLHITSGQKIVIKNKLDVDGLEFNDTLAEDYLNNYLNITITKISGEDIFNP
jgi:hypothetical protein